jgi:PAS domain-containing protein
MNQIDERDRVENALRASESLFRKVLDTLPVGVWIIDQQGKIIHGNPACYEIWGGAKFVGMDQYQEYKARWPDTGKRIEPEEWAAVRAITQGEITLDEEVAIESFDGKHKIMLNSPFHSLMTRMRSAEQSSSIKT